MKYDFNQTLLDLDDKKITQPIYDDTQRIICDHCGIAISTPKKIGEEDLTLALISRSALINLTQEELKLPGDKKNDRAILAMQIKAGEKNQEEIELNLKDAALIRKLIDEKYAPLIVMRSREILDQKDQPS